MSRVVLAMSGGVDSSVAAQLLCRAGHEVIGVFMRHGESSPATCASQAVPSTSPLPIISASAQIPSHGTATRQHKQGCCSASDADDARRVAARLDIPFYAVDFADEFGRIMDYFVDEYSAGRTPNPCVVCNNWLKFGKLGEYADGVGAEFIATGHYARLMPSAESGEPPALCRGIDPGKDQSYVLFGIDRAVLDRVLFPVGDFHKDAIRDIARTLGLRVADKRDSQEICFVPDGDYAKFVRRRRTNDEDRGGEIVTADETVLGRHSGIEQFTVGQRKGLRIAVGEPRYVVRIEPDSRRVVIGARDELERRADGKPSELADRRTDRTIHLRSENPLCHAARHRKRGAARVGSLRGAVRRSAVRRGPRSGGSVLPRRSGSRGWLDRILGTLPACPGNRRYELL